jgi:hypothetical protein
MEIIDFLLRLVFAFIPLVIFYYYLVWGVMEMKSEWKEKNYIAAIFIVPFSAFLGSGVLGLALLILGVI